MICSATTMTGGLGTIMCVTMIKIIAITDINHLNHLGGGEFLRLIFFI